MTFNNAVFDFKEPEVDIMKAAYWSTTDWLHWLISYLLPAPKLTRLPGRDRMLHRLNRASSESGLQAGFFPILLRNAGRRVKPESVLLMLDLAIHDYAKDLPPVRDALSFRREEFIVALVVNARARRAALARLAEVTAENQAARQERVPPPPDQAGEAARVRLFPAVMLLAAICDEFLDERGRRSSEGHRSGGPNPYYHQTRAGLFLEMYYGLPSKLWTPWGEWHFADMRFGADVEGFMSRLTLVEFMPETEKMGAPVGPVYVIVAIDGETLPEAVLADPSEFLSVDDVHGEWERLLAEYAA